MKFQFLLKTLILFDSKDDIDDLAHLILDSELIDLIDQVCKAERNSDIEGREQAKAEVISNNRI
ncbi:hypothetical protein CR513_47047, partial [Mucuna pruriens]